MSEYSIVRLDDAKLPYLQELYKNAFHTEVSLSYLQKKYDTAAFGLKYTGFLALSKDNQPAAYYGVFPCICNYQGNPVLVAQSGDTMTHSEHRGKGLFTLLAKETYDFAASQGVKFVFGFPNKNSYPGFVGKLNWQHKEDLNVYKLKVKTVPLAKIARKFPFLAGSYEWFCNKVLAKYLSPDAVFENSLLNAGENSIQHDVNYFRYKTYFKSYVLNLHGKKVWVKYEGMLWLGDMEPVSEQEFDQILAQLRRIAARTGANEIRLHASPGTPLDRFFARHTTAFAKVPIGYIGFDERVDAGQVKYYSADLDTF